MQHKSNVDESCPQGHGECPVLREVLQLRAECDRLLQLAVTDPLTGFFNYRYMLNRLDQEMERTNRTGVPTGLIMIDLDHFKDINDSYGHYAGDKILQWTCALWRRNVRRIDIPCRYGGEEFVIILPGTDLSQAVMLAERLHAIMNNTKMNFEDHEIHLTASFGVVAYRGQKPLSALNVLDCADQMLLRAKMQGRNRVYSESPEPPEPCTEVTPEERIALFVDDDEESEAKSRHTIHKKQ